MTLKDTKPGDNVISNTWTGMKWGEQEIPRQLIVVKHEGDCVWCKPADGLTSDAIPLFSGLVCRKTT